MGGMLMHFEVIARSLIPKFWRETEGDIQAEFLGVFTKSIFYFK